MKANSQIFTLIAFLIIINLITISTGQANDDSQKIKIGDVVEILVYGQEDMTRIVKVSTEGTINFPFLQNIPIDGLTLAELRDIIVVQLSKYSQDSKPIVTLRFLNTYIIYVTVLGQVRKPGTYQISQNSTIQGVVGEAGGFLPGAKLKEIQIIRQNHAGNEKFNVDLEQFMLQADISLLPPLEDGDVIFIPGWPGANSVKITGEVKIPGNYEVFADLQTVLDIIFKAGGTSEDADLSRVHLISSTKEGGTEIKINIEECLRNSDFDKIPTVKPGDVIYVPKKLKYWKIFVQVMRDITSFATLYIIFTYGKRL